MSEKLAVLMEFNGYTKDELEAYLSLKFGSMTKGGMTASILSQSGYEKAKSVIFGQPQLNENQQEMLQEVIKQYDITKPKTVLHALEHLSMIAFLLDEMEEVTEEDCIVVAQAFLDWAQEQEEE